jgi:hypothetical protein
MFFQLNLVFLGVGGPSQQMMAPTRAGAPNVAAPPQMRPGKDNSLI